MDETPVTTPHGALWVREAGEGHPLVCLHGFSLHGRMFAALAQQEAPLRVLAPDLPGHGRTTVRPVDLPTTLSSLGAWLEPHGHRLPVLGYSQGGRIALHLAIRRPDLVSHLVLISAGTGLGPARRRARRVDDDALAAKIETAGLHAFLDSWLSDPLTGTGRWPPADAAADRRLREENKPAGLAAALRGLGQGTLEQIQPDRLRQPTLWVAGARDARYVAIAEDAARRSGGGTVVVEDAGHNVVAERPDVIARVAADFLRA